MKLIPIKIGGTGPAAISASTTYLFGNKNSDPSNTALTQTMVVSTKGSNDGRYRTTIPFGGVIVAANLTVWSYKAAKGSSSTETSTISIRVNNTTDTTLFSTINNTATSSGTISFYQNNALNIQLAPNDYFDIKWVTPAWSTAPTNVSIEGIIWISIP